MPGFRIKSNLLTKAFVLVILMANMSFLIAEESAIASLKQTSKAFASIAKEVSPAVVNIQSESSNNPDTQDQDDENSLNEDDIPPPFLDLFRNMDPRLQPYPYRKQQVIRQGSGFIIRKNGYIITNNHLVQSAGKITVRLLDDKEFVAKVIGADPQTDIAVLKIEANNLPVVSLGDSDGTEVGEWVVAIGNPFGLSHSLSAGIISAKGRSTVRIADYENFLQTDAAINPGNSGGVLVDLEGKVIGINTAIYSRSGGYMGIGFAIPINMAKTIFEQLIAKGSVVRGFLGVKIQELTKDLAESFGLKDRKGILIAQLEKNSPAEKAGLKQGDVIVSLDSKPVEGTGEFRNTVAAIKPGTVHLIGILRDQKPMTLQVSVGTLENANSKEAKPEDQQVINKFGISVQNINAEIAAKLGVKPGVGVVVSKVKPGSLGELSGFTKGTVILEVNRQKVNNVTQFTSALSKLGPNKSVLFLMQDHLGSRYVVINLG